MTVHVESLVEVPLRDVWKDEAATFTPWLAENLDTLASILGMNLELVGTEMAVGPFSADIVAEEVDSGHKVVIENLLEATDHDHLGKMITYASGLEAAYAVLVAKRFRPEHRSALKWLNDLSVSGTGFFGLEIHAVRIGDSAPAAQLELVVEPDDWQRQVRETAAGTPSASSARYIEWWTEFLEAVNERFPGWTSSTSPSTKNWMKLPSGRSGIWYGVSFGWPVGADGYHLRVELYMRNGAEYFPLFQGQQPQVDAALGAGVEWSPLEDSKASRIAVYLDPADPDDRESWPHYRAWVFDRLAEFRDVFQPIIDSMP